MQGQKRTNSRESSDGAGSDVEEWADSDDSSGSSGLVGACRFNVHTDHKTETENGRMLT